MDYFCYLSPLIIPSPKLPLMKTIFTLLLCTFLIGTKAQLTYDYTIRILDNQGRPMPNVPVRLIETTSMNRIVIKTDQTGVAKTTFNSGKEWAISIKEMRNCAFLELPESGTGRSSRTITYDMETYLRERRPTVDRSNLNFDVIDQQSIGNPRPDDKNSVVRVKIFKRDRSPLTRYPVQLTCYKTNKQYLGKTGSDGIANFLVPFDNDYEIDIDGIETFAWIDIGNRAGISSTSIAYEPSNIKEKVINGFIEQTIPDGIEPTSAHAKVVFNLTGGPNEGIKEDVYLRMLGSNKIYHAVSDENGKVIFMLPVKRKYMIDFKFQHDVDVVDLSKARGFAWHNMSIRYIPDPRLQYPERFIPTPEQLVIKEFNDFLTKQYPDPTENNIDFHLKWGNKVNANSKEALMELGFSTKENPPKSRAPINICFVIDKSGSMAGANKIESLKEALLNFVDKLRPSDVVSIVAFESESRILVSPMPAGNKNHLKDVIHSIEAGGGTNIYNGLVMGGDQVLKKMISNGTNRIVLLTDGYGVTEPAVIAEKSKAYHEKGVEISTIGVGGGYNQALLTQLATTGGGLLHFAGDASKIKEAFARELSDVLYPIAKKATVEIEYNDKIVYRQLYGFPSSEIAKGTVQMTMNNLYAGLNKLAFVKFDLHEPTKSIMNQPILVRLSYTDIGSGKEIVVEKKTHLEWNEATGELDMIIDKESRKMYAIAIINQSLKVMAEAFESGDYVAAKKSIVRAQAQLREVFPDAQDEDITRLVDQMETYASAFDQIATNKQMH